MNVKGPLTSKPSLASATMIKEITILETTYPWLQPHRNTGSLCSQWNMQRSGGAASHPGCESPGQYAACSPTPATHLRLAAVCHQGYVWADRHFAGVHSIQQAPAAAVTGGYEEGEG